MPDEPQRYILSIAYKAGPDPRITKGADGGRDCIQAELERAAFSYLAKGNPQVGMAIWMARPARHRGRVVHLARRPDGTSATASSSPKATGSLA